MDRTILVPAAIATQSNSDRANSEVNALRATVNQLIPVAEALVELIKLRAKSNLVVLQARTRHQPYRVVDNDPLLNLSKSLCVNTLKSFQKTIDELWFDSHEDIVDTMRQLKILRGEIDLAWQTANVLFNHSILPISMRVDLVQILVSKIGHPELIREAESNCNMISKLMHSIIQLLGYETTDMPADDKLQVSTLLALDVLDDKAEAVIGAMTAIEVRRLRVEELVCEDQRRSHATIQCVVTYILALTTVLIGIPIFFIVLKMVQPQLNFSIPYDLSKNSFNEYKIPLLGVPLPIIIWSFIGSFAAMIHRFNRKSVYYFTDAVKWMITRHVQGIILSCAFYLVLFSGLFLLSGNGDTQLPLKTEAVLVLSFLIGFSDRFVDGVFNTLIDRYSRNPRIKEEEEKKETKSA